MSEQRKIDSILASFRALDLTDDKGFWCGKVLGDLGADVIKIEPLGGDPSRNIGPFYHDIPDPEKSLYWFALNANKRGITLDIQTRDGREIFKRLAKDADFVIESFPAGYMDELGLGYSVLSEINPRLIITSITPFGQTGPFRDHKTSDIVAMAVGGLMCLSGDPDRPPVRMSFPQAYLNAGAEAALGTIIAHYYRETTGEGQHVDVSIQESIMPNTLLAPLFWEFEQTNLRRAGSRRGGLGAATLQRVIYPCKDGYVSFGFVSGRVGVETMQKLVQWMDSEGTLPDFLKDYLNLDWHTFDIATITQDELDRVGEALGKFFRRYTKAELYEESFERRIMLYPVATAKDIVEDRQLKARDFWIEVQHPELGSSITYPGEMAKLSETPLRLWRRAPLIGEHNAEIYEGELGFSREELIMLTQAGIV